jgi:acyl-homoserine lactone synthase
MQEPMIFVVGAGNRREFAVDIAAMHSQRKIVFVDRVGWKLPVIADLEIDRYDLLEDTRYLLAKDQPNGPVLASARLLTTKGPHLMEDLYSGPYRAALPRGPMVWEASRYCTAPGIGDRHKRLGLLWETICGIMETALEHRIDQIIFAANRAMLRLAMECGWEARTEGPTMSDGNDQVTAVVAEMTLEGLRNVRDRHGVAEPIIRSVADTTSHAGCRHGAASTGISTAG